MRASLRPILLNSVPGWVRNAYPADVLPFLSLAAHYDQDLYWVRGRGQCAIGDIQTCTRAQTVPSYATTASGLLVPFAANTNRRTDAGDAIEQAATNYFLQSQTFDNATWVKTNATVTADATTAPDGTTTADKLVASAGSAQHYVAQAVSGLTAAEGRVATVYAKYAGVQYLAMYMSQGPVQAWFDLQGGTVSNITGSASITALGNGWYRCQIYNSAATGTGDTYELHTASIAGNFTHTGDGVNGIYLWGAQLERPTTLASSYIPTTTVAVARAGDVTAPDPTKILTPSGAILIVYNLEGINPNQGEAWAMSDTGNNRLALRAGVGNTTPVFLVGSGSGVGSASGSSTGTGVDVKIASTWGPSSAALSQNGAAAVSVGNGWSGTSAGTFWIGRSENATTQLDGSIKRFASFQAQVSNAQLQALAR